MDGYSGSDLLYLNPSGAIPEDAVLVKGSRRDKPFRERRVFDTTGFTAQQEIKEKLEDESEVEVEEDIQLDKRQLEETEG